MTTQKESPRRRPGALLTSKNDHLQDTTRPCPDCAQHRADAERWRALLDGHPAATLIPDWSDLAEYGRLRDAAAEQQLLEESPHVAELRAEWIEWDRRRSWSESTAAISSLVDWRQAATTPTYAELERRRGRTQRVFQCDWKLCGAPATPHRSPVTRAPIALCAAHSHLAIPETRAGVSRVAA